MRHVWAWIGLDSVQLTNHRSDPEEDDHRHSSSFALLRGRGRVCRRDGLPAGPVSPLHRLSARWKQSLQSYMWWQRGIRHHKRAPIPVSTFQAWTCTQRVFSTFHYRPHIYSCRATAKTADYDFVYTPCSGGHCTFAPGNSAVSIVVMIYYGDRIAHLYYNRCAR